MESCASAVWCQRLDGDMRFALRERRLSCRVTRCRSRQCGWRRGDWRRAGLDPGPQPSDAHSRSRHPPQHAPWRLDRTEPRDTWVACDGARFPTVQRHWAGLRPALTGHPVSCARSLQRCSGLLAPWQRCCSASRRGWEGTREPALPLVGSRLERKISTPGDRRGQLDRSRFRRHSTFQRGGMVQPPRLERGTSRSTI